MDYTPFKIIIETSLVVQWLSIFLPMQGTWAWSLVQEDSPCHGTIKPEHHNYSAWASRAHALQQEKPPQYEAHAPQQK